MMNCESFARMYNVQLVFFFLFIPVLIVRTMIELLIIHSLNDMIWIQNIIINLDSNSQGGLKGCNGKRYLLLYFKVKKHLKM